MKVLISICSGLLVLCFAFAKANWTNLSRSERYSSLAEIAIYQQQDTLAKSIDRGSEIYTEYCIQCHLSKGEGVPGTFPPLAKSDWLLPEKRNEAIQVIKYGQNGEITVNGVTYNGVMAELGLYDDEIADVMNYILNNWGNSSDQMVTEEEVKEVDKK